jgi:hypothetical protein
MCVCRSLTADLSGLGQGEVLRDGTDIGANGVLILSEAFEHEDAASDVNADAVALPVPGVDLSARETEVAALIDVAEHAEPEVDRTEDFGVEGAESGFGLLQGDSSFHFVSYAFLVGGRTKAGFRLKGEAEATIDFAIGRQDESVGKNLQKLGRAFFIVLVSLVLPAELVGVGYEVIDSTPLGFGFAWRQRPAVDRNQPAKGAVGCFDDVLFPEVTAGAGRALVGDVEVVWSSLSSGDFIRGHLLDKAGFLSQCAGGEQGEGDDDSSQWGVQACLAIH